MSLLFEYDLMAVDLPGFNNKRLLQFYISNSKELLWDYALCSSFIVPIASLAVTQAQICQNHGQNK